MNIEQISRDYSEHQMIAQLNTAKQETVVDAERASPQKVLPNIYEMQTHLASQKKGDEAYERAMKMVNSLLQEQKWPQYRKLQFFDKAGVNYFYEFPLDVKRADTSNPAKENQLILTWLSPLELRDIFNATPRLVEEIGIRQKLKEGRRPHPSDGVVHWIEIIFGEDVEPRVKVTYTSGVYLDGAFPPLVEGDTIYPDYLNVWSTLWLNFSDFGLSATKYQL